MKTPSGLRWGAVAGLASLTLAASASAQPVTVFDLTGRQIELAAPAERIVTFPVPSASVVIGLSGGIDLLAAIHPESRLAIEHGILGEFFPGAHDIPTAILADGATRGWSPDLAALQAIDPDLVIQWEHAGEDFTSLAEAGLDTALLVFGTEQNVRDAIRMIGTAIGQTQKVDIMMAWRDLTSALIEAGLAQIPQEDRPRVAYFFYALTDLYTEGFGTYFDWQIRHLGAINVAEPMQGWGEVDTATVVEWNPDIILLGNFEPGLHTNRIFEDEHLGGTNAADDGRVYMMPLGGYRWGPGSLESPLAWMWMANLFYPDHFDFNLRAEIAEWYPRLYGHAPTEAQIDAILELEINGESAHYSRFAVE